MRRSIRSLLNYKICPKIMWHWNESVRCLSHTTTRTNTTRLEEDPSKSPKTLLRLNEIGLEWATVPSEICANVWLVMLEFVFSFLKCQVALRAFLPITKNWELVSASIANILGTVETGRSLTSMDTF